MACAEAALTSLPFFLPQPATCNGDSRGEQPLVYAVPRAFLHGGHVSAADSGFKAPLCLHRESDVQPEPCYTIVLAFLIFGEGREINFSFYIGIALILLSVLLQTLRAIKAPAAPQP